jgi:hypothetical protein
VKSQRPEKSATGVAHLFGVRLTALTPKTLLGSHKAAATIARPCVPQMH